MYFLVLGKGGFVFELNSEFILIFKNDVFLCFRGVFEVLLKFLSEKLDLNRFVSLY